MYVSCSSNMTQNLLPFDNITNKIWFKVIAPPTGNRKFIWNFFNIKKKHKKEQTFIDDMGNSYEEGEKLQIYFAR